MLNILGRRYWYFLLSSIVIIPGILAMIIWGLPFSIDFTGGSLLEVSFEARDLPQPAEVINLYVEYGIQDAQVQTTGRDTIVVRSTFLSDETRSEIVTTMEERYSSPVTVLRFESVGPTIGREVTIRAGLGVAIAAFLVVLYITWAFRGVSDAFRYGICAVLAMVHDVGVLFSLVAIGSRFFGWQIDTLFLTALLTVIGCSRQDTVVVFDRIRENAAIYRRLPFENLVNHSIVQTLQRSINTQLMTVEFMLLALAMFGGITLRQFAITLLVGLFSGTYSSIFISAPVLVVWEYREWQSWFRSRRRET